MIKKSYASYTAPKLARWLLKRIISIDIRYSALGDFEEIYFSITEEKGIPKARIWYWTQVVKSLPSFFEDSIYWRIDMIQNYLKVAFRNMMRHKVFSFINITGLAIGMAVCFLILLWVQDELSYDRFHENADNIYRVNINDKNYGYVWTNVSIPVGPALKDGFPEIIDAARYRDFSSLVTRDKKKFDVIGAYADPSFFEIFSFPFIKGTPLTALSEPSSIVITEGMAKKFFGSEDPLGKSLKLNNDFDVTVTGVIEDMPQNSQLFLDFLAPFQIFEKRDRDPSNWGRFQISTYVLLQDAAPFKECQEKIAGLLQEHNVRSGTQLELEPLTRIHLYAVDGRGSIQYVIIFSFVAVFILIIACVNFMNLATARSSTRVKEIGMRKVTGAKRMDLVKQFMGESVLISLIALFAAVVLVLILLPALNNLTNKQLTLNPQGNWSLVLGFVGILLFTGLLSGSYPALFLSSFKPVNILGGTLVPTSSRKQKTLFRKVLVVFQFSVSLFLIISTLVVFKQLHFIQHRNLGYEKEHILSVPLRGGTARQYEALKNELLQDSRIQHVTATSAVPVLIGRIHTDYDWEGKDPKKESRMTELLVDFDFIKTLNMTLAQGRDFSKDHPADASTAYIVNEAAVKAMDIVSPVGKRFSASTHDGMRDGEIIGVVKDFHFKPLQDEIEPLVMFFQPGNFNYICIKTQSDIFGLSGTIKHIENTWKKFAPNFPFSYSFLYETFDRLYRSEQNTGRIFGYFTFLAIFISCLGLFGLAAQMAELRTKEIGIRKVMGASVPRVTMFLSKDFMKWVISANVIAWPTAYFAMNKWLQDFAYRARMGVEIFILAAMLAFFIALAAVGFQSIRAAMANPVDSLRYE